ncbi:hypothetical protein OROGR_007829 [Orobanche gracilis]
MSQDYHQGIFNFSNGFEGSPAPPPPPPQQQHVAQQIRRDKLRVQGFGPPPTLVGMEDEESGGSLPVNYETDGMLSEMFNFPSGGATELLENQILQSYRNPRAAPPPGTADWFLCNRHGMDVVVGDDLGVFKNHTVANDPETHHHRHQHQISDINADSTVAMQLFLMNPQQQHQQRSPSPSPSTPPPSQPTSSTLHMLLPNPSRAGGPFGQFTWVNNPNSADGCRNPSEIPGVVEAQGLSLSLSSSLQHMEAAKAEGLRMEESNMLFFGQGGGGSTPAAAQYQFKNPGGALNPHSGVGPSHQLHVGPSSYGAMNMLRNSKYAKAAQELLEEFCSVGRGQFKKNKFRRRNNENGNPSSAGGATSGGGCGTSSSSSKDMYPLLPAADRIEHQRRKVKLLSMIDEVDRRYNHYCEQMQMVVNSFDMVMGFGSAVPYTYLAQKAMSRHFRCLKDGIAAQLKQSCELLGEKDAGGTGVTKGETPRLRILEQSLRQQRAFHQMGMMEQEAWRPQRGLPERSVNILRAWLFEHFLHPYPSDADKHLLARQTGLSRNQVSNWFINARVRLWKPMVEEMYQQEAKEDDEFENDDEDDDDDHDQRDQTNSATAQTPKHNNNSNNSAQTTTATSAAVITPPSSAGKRVETINAHENDPSFMAINTPRSIADAASVSFSSPPAGFTAVHSFQAMHEPADDADDIGQATLIRFGTGSAGDVSLTLGLRHAGNLPEKSRFSVRDLGGC